MLRRPPKSTRTDTLFPYTALFRSSSSINGMAYVRGHARDYDRWVQGGLAGWDYSQVLPYFRKAETYERGADAYRGGDGPLQVRSEEHTSELQSLMRSSYAVFCLKKIKTTLYYTNHMPDIVLI